MEIIFIDEWERRDFKKIVEDVDEDDGRFSQAGRECVARLRRGEVCTVREQPVLICF